MKLVIEIDEEDKKEIDERLKDKGIAFWEHAELIKSVLLAVFHGTPLPKGHWVSLSLPEEQGKETDVYFMCDKCKNASRFISKDLIYPICPNCGADMREADEVEE